MHAPLPGSFTPIVGGKRRVFAFHRANGAGEYAPNSLPAIAACIAAGAPRIEVDVQFLADGALLVLHDGHLEGETTGVGPARDLTARQARALRYRDASETPLCFLEEVVELFRGSEAVLQVDLKAECDVDEGRAAALAGVLAPLGGRLVVGSMAHWNLRPLAALGVPVALDPTLHWHARPDRAVGDGRDPARLGAHGYFDDAPVARVADVPFRRYLESRIADLVGLLPAVEWMVDRHTVLRTLDRGVALGDELATRGIELAAWTLNDTGPETARELGALFEAGVTTVITDTPMALSRIVAA